MAAPSSPATAASGSAPLRELHVRTIDLPLDRESQKQAERPIPRHWMAGNAFATALANGVNLLFPAGERFFIRSVRHFLPEVSEELRQLALGFFGQEGRHAQAHDRVNRLLAEHGYEVEGFLHLYESVCYRIIERIASAELRLAGTAACEHFTAILADAALRSEMLGTVDPTMEKLLKWHACEEIEHKAVAYDVLQQVNPSYRLRIEGLLLASVCLGTFWFAAAAMLLYQDLRREDLGPRRVLGDLTKVRKWRKQVGRKGVVRDVFLRGIKEYVRRDFHPNQNDNYAVARRYLESVGLGESPS